MRIIYSFLHKVTDILCGLLGVSVLLSTVYLLYVGAKLATGNETDNMLVINAFTVSVLLCIALGVTAGINLNLKTKLKTRHVDGKPCVISVTEIEE